MRIGDMVYTPRFCHVRIEAIFSSRSEAAAAGYTEPTHYTGPGYGIAGKSSDMYHMTFAAYVK